MKLTLFRGYNDSLKYKQLYNCIKDFSLYSDFCKALSFLKFCILLGNYIFKKYLYLFSTNTHIELGP